MGSVCSLEEVPPDFLLLLLLALLEVIPPPLAAVPPVVIEVETEVPAAPYRLELTPPSIGLVRSRIWGLGTACCEDEVEFLARLDKLLLPMAEEEEEELP